jgi:hypothetical protein
MSDGTTGSGRRQRTFSGTFWNSKNNPITMMVNAYNRRQQRRSVEAEARDREASRANEITWPFSFEHVYHVTVDPESATGFNVSCALCVIPCACRMVCILPNPALEDYERRALTYFCKIV